MSRFRPLLVLAAIAALGAGSAAIAVGATPTAPAVTTAPATAVTDTGAIVHGTVNPEGQPTRYAFQWGPTVGYGHETALSSAGAGTTAAAVSSTLANLPSGSIVHFRTIAINAAGAMSVGADQTFTTTGTAPAPTAAPAASTGTATKVAQSSMTLAGTVNPKGQATTYWFEYGTTTNYGFETPAIAAGAGSADVSASASVTGLASSTTYHFRLVAASPGGTTLGADQTAKTTTPPEVTTEGASKADSSSAVLNALVNPEGQATTYYFQFGTSTAYGLQTLSVNLGSGTSTVAVHRHPDGLLPGTTYHYRVVAENAGGISYGADKTLTTSGPVRTPSQLRVLGKMGFVSRGGWVGPVIGCFAGGTPCTGRYTLTYRSTTIAQRNFSMNAASGWPTNVRLNTNGRRLFGRTYRHSVLVQLTVTTTGGQRISEAFTLARWR